MARYSRKRNEYYTRLRQRRADILIAAVEHDVEPGREVSTWSQPIDIDYDTPPIANALVGDEDAFCLQCMGSLHRKRIIHSFFCSLTCSFGYRRDHAKHEG